MLILPYPRLTLYNREVEVCPLYDAVMNMLQDPRPGLMLGWRCPMAILSALAGPADSKCGDMTDFDARPTYSILPEHCAHTASPPTREIGSREGRSWSLDTAEGEVKAQLLVASQSSTSRREKRA